MAACKIIFPDYPVEYVDGKTSTYLGGHGGVLGYDSNGKTQYYEYGRYNPNGGGVIGAHLPKDDGNVRRVSTPNLKIGKDGNPTKDSMDALEAALSRNSGKGAKAVLTCDASADEGMVYAYANGIAKNKNRAKYSWKPWNSNQCRDFAKKAYEAGQ